VWKVPEAMDNDNDSCYCEQIRVELTEAKRENGKVKIELEAALAKLAYLQQTREEESEDICDDASGFRHFHTGPDSSSTSSKASPRG
jgi:hypothetical protein